MRKLLFFALFASIMASCTNNSNQSNLLSEKSSSSQCDSIKQALETNKKIVSDFYQEIFGDKDLSAVDRYIAPEYIQHNPSVPDGAEPFREAAKGWFEGAPRTKVDIQHIAAEGDLVFIHIKNTNPDGSLQSVIDIFRLADGKIVEHWDVMQDVPKEAANDHPMF